MNRVGGESLVLQLAAQLLGARLRSHENEYALSLAAANAQRLPQAQQIKLAYALGKANQDLGRYDDAFNSFAAGAQLQARAQPYDWKSNFAMMRDARATLTATRLRKLCELRGTNLSHGSGADTSDPIPIFILGMPRSGSRSLNGNTPIRRSPIGRPLSGVRFGVLS